MQRFSTYFFNRGFFQLYIFSSPLVFCLKTFDLPIPSSWGAPTGLAFETPPVVLFLSPDGFLKVDLCCGGPFCHWVRTGIFKKYFLYSWLGLFPGHELSLFSPSWDPAAKFWDLSGRPPPLDWRGLGLVALVDGVRDWYWGFGSTPFSNLSSLHPLEAPRQSLKTEILPLLFPWRTGLVCRSALEPHNFFVHGPYLCGLLTGGNFL